MIEYPSWPHAKKKPRSKGLYWFSTGRNTEGRGRVGYNIPTGELIIEVFKINDQNHSQRFVCELGLLELAPAIKADYEKLLNYATPHVLE